MKIFISYSHKDSNFVLPIAEELLKIYGKESVIIDKFSNHPGDSLVGFVNSSLEVFTHFIFFISQNSINSYLVSMEWKNALLLCKDKSRRFIPVIVDSVQVPAILNDKIYVNLYAHGILHAFQEIRDSIDSNSYIDGIHLNNLNARIKIQENRTQLTIVSKLYSEPNASFCVVFKKKQSVKINVEEAFQGGTETREFDGEERFLVFIRLFRVLTTDSPFCISFSFETKDNEIYQVIHVKENDGHLNGVPINIEYIKQ